MKKTKEEIIAINIQISDTLNDLYENNNCHSIFVMLDVSNEIATQKARSDIDKIPHLLSILHDNSIHIKNSIINCACQLYMDMDKEDQIRVLNVFENSLK